MHVDTNSQKLKVDWKVLGGAGLKNKCGQSGLWPLKLTVSQEKTNGLNWFFDAGTISHKLKGDWKFLGWTWSKMGVASLGTGL